MYTQAYSDEGSQSARGPLGWWVLLHHQHPYDRVMLYTGRQLAGSPLRFRHKTQENKENKKAKATHTSCRTPDSFARPRRKIIAERDATNFEATMRRLFKASATSPNRFRPGADETRGRAAHFGSRYKKIFARLRQQPNGTNRRQDPSARCVHGAEQVDCARFLFGSGAISQLRPKRPAGHARGPWTGTDATHTGGSIMI